MVRGGRGHGPHGARAAGAAYRLAKSVGEIIAAGAVGINLEDGTGRAGAPMLGIDNVRD